MLSQENLVHKMKLREREAQSTFEYIILVAAVVAVVVAFVSSPFFQQSVNKVIDDGIDQLAKTTEGIDFDIPAGTPDFDEPMLSPNLTPPDDWESPAAFTCSHTDLSSPIQFLGLDSEGFPRFSDRYIGNPTREQGNPNCQPNQPHNNLFQLGDQNVLLMRSRASGTDWVAFDWNNPQHLWHAFNYQRYGSCYSGGAFGMHSTDYFWALQTVYEREPTCLEIYDHYYGKLKAQGLSGEDADLNGLEIIAAASKKSLKESMDPNSPNYMGTPQEPGEFHQGWDRDSWISAYCRIKSLGLQPHFDFDDIGEAFPVGGPVPSNVCSQL
jgi:hypothetical protein